MCITCTDPKNFSGVGGSGPPSPLDPCMHFNLDLYFLIWIVIHTAVKFLGKSVGKCTCNFILVFLFSVGWRQERKVAGSPQIPFRCHVINYLKYFRHMHNMDFISKGFFAAFISSKGQSRCDTSAIIFYVDLYGLSCSNCVICVYIYLNISFTLRLLCHIPYFINMYFNVLWEAMSCNIIVIVNCELHCI